MYANEVRSFIMICKTNYMLSQNQTDICVPFSTEEENLHPVCQWGKVEPPHSLSEFAIQGVKQEASNTKRLQQQWFHGQQSKCFCSYPQWSSWKSPSPNFDQLWLLPTVTALNPSLMRMSQSILFCVPPLTPRSVTLSLSLNPQSRFASLTRNSVCPCH